MKKVAKKAAVKAYANAYVKPKKPASIMFLGKPMKRAIDPITGKPNGNLTCGKRSVRVSVKEDEHQASVVVLNDCGLSQSCGVGKTETVALRNLESILRKSAKLYA